MGLFLDILLEARRLAREAEREYEIRKLIDLMVPPIELFDDLNKEGEE